MTRFALACCCAFSLGLAPAAAQTATPPSQTPAPAAGAVAPSPEAVKIAAAMAKVTSLRMVMSSPSGLAGTITAVIPQKRTKATFAMGSSMTTEMVTADGHVYMRTNGSDWRVTDLPSQMANTTHQAMMNPANIHILPDRVENGTTVGVYETPTPTPAGVPAGTVIPSATCTYDKTTYLPRRCSIAAMTQTFEGWNDPANVVDVPVLTSRAPAASAHP